MQLGLDEEENIITNNNNINELKVKNNEISKKKTKNKTTQIKPKEKSCKINEENISNTRPINFIKFTHDKKRPRDKNFNQEMDLEGSEDSKSIGNKKKKVPLRKLIERISLEDNNNNNKSKKQKNTAKEINKNNKNKRCIKIFSDMSVSEISNNLFKNYYPSVLPPYYPEQIKDQIIDKQIELLIKKVNEKDTNNKKGKENNIKNGIIQQSMNYLRKLAEEQGEWIDNENNREEFIDDEEKDENDFDESDSNDENNERNSYPDEESDELKDGDEGFDDNEYNYEDYDGEDDYY